MKKLSVLIAASGTGGHLFPALHIAKAVMALNPENTVTFIGSGRDLEAEIIDKAGFKREVIKAQRVMQEGVRGLLRFGVTLPSVLKTTYRIFKRSRPNVVIGVGGYATVPPILLAWALGIPTVIHEAEISPGLANRFLSLFATKVTLGFKDAGMPWYARTIYTGHPVREELRGIAEDPIPTTIRNILITGGSQGARALDEALCELAPFLSERKLKLTQQVRPENKKKVEDAYRAAGVMAELLPFINDMPQALRNSDIVISRAGAGSISELGAVNRPAILIPYPHAQGGHQRANALTLVSAGKGILVEEGPQFVERLKAALTQLLDMPTYTAMRSSPVTAKGLEAAPRIATLVSEIAK